MQDEVLGCSIGVTKEEHMIQNDLSLNLRSYWNTRHTVVGLFEDIDFLLFDRILTDQTGKGLKGDLLEIGTFMGKSAIVIGLHAQDAERLIVCDIFEDSTADTANDRENAASYGGLTRQAFESTYARYVPRSATILQELSSHVREHVQDGSIRFAHIDGSHLFKVVEGDIANVRHLLGGGGVVVFDDFRAVHSPGVAAAVWAAVANDGLLPICLSDTKFYGTWSESVADDVRESTAGWLSRHPEVRTGQQSIHGGTVLLVANPLIWTTRRRIKALLPPALTERLLGRQRAHLGG
jgi:hypothetical protein